MRGMNLVMLAVLVLGLLGVAAAARSPLDGGAMDPPLQEITCVINVTTNCPFVLREQYCSLTECEGDTCPAGTKEYIRLNSYLSTRSVNPGEWGNDTNENLGPKWCQLVRPCLKAGQSGILVCTLPNDDGKRFCKGGVDTNAPYEYNDEHIQRRQAGKACDSPAVVN